MPVGPPSMKTLIALFTLARFLNSLHSPEECSTPDEYLGQYEARSQRVFNSGIPA